MSRIFKLFTRLLYAGDRLGDAIDTAGGMLRVGVYDVDLDVGDAIGRVRAFKEAFEHDEVLRQLMPFRPEVGDLLQAMEDSLVAGGFVPQYFSSDAEIRRPKLHLKTHFIASERALATLIPRPGWPDLIQGYGIARAEQLTVRDRYLDAKQLRASMTEVIEPFV
jgi:hypothetical protein